MTFLVAAIAFFASAIGTICGSGGFAGCKVNSRIDDRAVDKLIMGICAFNMVKYMGV